MMSAVGRIAELDGRMVAALLRRGRVDDLLVETVEGAGPQPGEVWRGRLDRVLPGGAGFLTSEAGALFLIDVGDARPGDALLVRILSLADGEPGKAPRATRKIELAGRFVTATPTAPGVNASRKINDPARRAALVAAVADRGSALCAGFVIRTAAQFAAIEEVADEAAALGAEAAALIAAADAPLGRAAASPPLVVRARAFWSLDADPSPATVTERARMVAAVAEARRRDAALTGGGRLRIEPAAGAHVLDVDAGARDVDAVNAAAADAVPRALRIRGIAGAVLIDFAGDVSADQKRLGDRVARAADAALDVLGWGPLGLLEMRRRADRPPLSRALPPTEAHT